MDLFVRESGHLDAPAIVFLHGGIMSGWSWGPVVDRLQHYYCLVPDLPQYGRSFDQGPFEMARGAEAVAKVIRSRTPTGRAHVVGFSLGAQVALQLLATDADLVDRALLSGTYINTMPAVNLTRRLVGMFARTAWFRWLLIDRHWYRDGAPSPPIAEDYIADARLNSGAHLAHIAVASAGFTVPEALRTSSTTTLFLAGSEETWAVRRWAALLARVMPDGDDRIAIGMRHDWPLRQPELFARTVDSWITGNPMPSEIGPGARQRPRGRRR